MIYRDKDGKVQFIEPAPLADALRDMKVHGIYITRDGKRIDPDDFYHEPPPLDTPTD